MKRFLTLGIIFLNLVQLFAYTKPEQSAKALIAADPSRAGNLHHHYEALDNTDTPAPEGYKAFYVSHAGRHGSRYLSNDREMKEVVPNLEMMQQEGLLTEDGERLLEAFHTLQNLHEGMYGMLTQRGAAEHRGIAKRLYDRVPEVFSQKDRDSITCVSTPVHRCIQSMANFAFSLKEQAPGIKVSFYSGERYRDYLNAAADDKRSIEQARHTEDSLLKAWVNSDRFVKRYFTGLVKGKYIGKKSPEKFMNYMLKIGSIYQCLDDPATPNIFSFFTTDELYDLWRVNNVRTYGGMCNSIESRGERNPRGSAFMEDFVAKADLALQKDSRMAADLRFAHDSGLGPFVSLLALEGNDYPLHILDANDNWFCFQNVCMGTNLQLIFYRNDKGDVLVKFLHNEKERGIPALKAVSGPYYKWSDVRSYMLKLASENPWRN